MIDLGATMLRDNPVDHEYSREADADGGPQEVDVPLSLKRNDVTLSAAVAEDDKIPDVGSAEQQVDESCECNLTVVVREDQ
jgi:hypothetical protein